MLAESGKGKTTLVNILLGFLPIQAGAIYINGIQQSQMNLKACWPAITYIKQQGFLFMIPL
jgi:ABC-type transport system involved in cytochrome bd biosynthesis fused ATPase/permease subunit